MGKFENNSLQRMGVFGGMFDPVHYGHLRIALECKQAFQLDELRMIPCAEPAHRISASVSGQQRLDMLQSALNQVDGIEADGRELQRTGPSYTVDTLASMKVDFPHANLFLVIGSDAFQMLNTWHQWQKILMLSNIIIARRPDNYCDRSSQVGELLTDCFTTDVSEFKWSEAGKIFSLNVTQLEISSSLIRRLLSERKSAQFLLPNIVLDEIEKNEYYR